MRDHYILRTYSFRLGVFAVAIALFACTNNAEKAIQEFYRHTGPEDTLMDPLILAGSKVVPPVIERVRDKDMPRRRYAIGFLGNGGYVQALHVLEQILHDSTEESLVRSDALVAIYQINSASALNYAEQYKGDPSYLGEVSRDIISGKDFLPPKRSYREALAGHLNR